MISVSDPDHVKSIDTSHTTLCSIKPNGRCNDYPLTDVYQQRNRSESDLSSNSSASQALRYDSQCKTVFLIIYGSKILKCIWLVKKHMVKMADVGSRTLARCGDVQYEEF